MKTIYSIAAALLALSSSGESLTERMNNAYDAAVAAKERLDAVMENVDIDAKVQEIQEEVDRLEEEHYRIMQESESAMQKAEDALASFSSLDFAAIDTSAIAGLKSKLESEVSFYDKSYSELVAAAELVISRVKDITSAPDWASWEWIIENFGGGWDTLPQDLQESIIKKASQCTVENCECMSNLYYTFDKCDAIYRITVQNYESLLARNGWLDKKHGSIP